MFNTVCEGADAVSKDLRKIEEEIGKGSVEGITLEQWAYFPEEDGQIDEFIKRLKKKDHEDPIQPIKRRPTMLEDTT